MIALGTIRWLIAAEWEKHSPKTTSIPPLPPPSRSFTTRFILLYIINFPPFFAMIHSFFVIFVYFRFFSFVFLRLGLSSFFLPMINQKQKYEQMMCLLRAAVLPFPLNHRPEAPISNLSICLSAKRSDQIINKWDFLFIVNFSDFLSESTTKKCFEQ